MTSSLVGSEMCIRDRGAAECWVLHLHLSCLSPLPVLPPFPLLSSTSVPVSYTHLTLPTICSV
eukprot:9065257-Prorocentrum_lima.AAC.1